MPMEEFESQVDLAYSLLLDLARSEIALKETTKDLPQKEREKIVRRINFLKAKLGSYEHQLAEELYNTLDSVILVAKIYGEKAAQREAAKWSYNIQPLLDILAEDVEKVECTRAVFMRFTKWLERVILDLENYIDNLCPIAR